MSTTPKLDGRTARRLATQAKLVAAVGQVLREDGVGGLGVNAIARRAGADKALIYRYYGGVAGLLRAYGESHDFWPSLDEILGAERQVLRLPPAQLAGRTLRNYAEALRRRPTTLELLAWETAERNELTAILEGVREAQSDLLFAELARAGLPMDGLVPVLGSLLASGLQYLAVRGRHVKLWGGLRLDEPSTWDGIEAAIAAAFAGVLEG